MKSILEKHVGKTVGINVDNPSKFNEATLIAVTENSLTVRVGKVMVHYPASSVISVIEPEDGVKLGKDAMWQDIKVPVGITVNHLIIYKGAVGIGFSF